MELFSFRRQFAFVQHRRRAFILSSLLVLASVASLAIQGLQLGIGFTGGYLIEVGFEAPAELAPIRDALAQAGLGDAQVQYFGSRSDILVRLGPRDQATSAELSDQVLRMFGQTFEQPFELQRVEFVGPQVGDDLREKGGLALLLAILIMFAYVAFRYEKRFALGAVAALIHDIVIIAGLFSIFRLEFDMTVVAALLAILGYSINDTIVVFDRIREDFRLKRRGNVGDIVDHAINSTVSRTMMTSLTTLIVVLALLAVGGEAVFAFALAMSIGIVVGTYSSIFIASTLVLETGLSRQDMLPVQKEGAADDRP